MYKCIVKTKCVVWCYLIWAIKGSRYLTVVNTKWKDDLVFPSCVQKLELKIEQQLKAVIDCVCVCVCVLKNKQRNGGPWKCVQHGLSALQSESWGSIKL